MYMLMRPQPRPAPPSSRRRELPTCPGGPVAGIATSPVAMTLLATIVLVAQALDLVSGLHMVLRYGMGAELNPLLRVMLISAGPAGAAVVKLGAAVLAVALLLGLARTGRTLLARNCLLIAVVIGFVGALSNGNLDALVPF
jgi:hypothetical protein